MISLSQVMRFFKSEVYQGTTKHFVKSYEYDKNKSYKPGYLADPGFPLSDSWSVTIHTCYGLKDTREISIRSRSKVITFLIDFLKQTSLNVFAEEIAFIRLKKTLFIMTLKTRINDVLVIICDLY